MIFCEFTLYLIPDCSIYSLSGFQKALVTTGNRFATIRQQGSPHHVVVIDSGDLHNVRQPSILVHPNMRFAPIMPCVALLDLMRIRLPFLFLIDK